MNQPGKEEEEGEEMEMRELGEDLFMVGDAIVNISDLTCTCGEEFLQCPHISAASERFCFVHLVRWIGFVGLERRNMISKNT